MSMNVRVARLNRWVVAQSRPLQFNRVTRLRRVADLLGISRHAKTRLAWFLWRDAHQATIAVTCRRFGITPKTYHHWAHRFDATNPRTLEDRPTTPHRRRQRTYTSLQYERLVALRRQHLRYGKEKLLRLYAAQFPEDRALSAWKVQCIIAAAGLYYHPAKNARTQAKRRRAEKRKRVTTLRVRHRTGFLFCLDTLVRYGVGTKRYIFTAIDRHAKLAFARMYASKNTSNARDFLLRLHHLVAGRIENVGHDNGSEFQGEFAATCRHLAIPQYHSRPQTPKDNAVNERFNRTLQDEFLQLGNFTTDTVRFNRRLTEWLVEYNFNRPHQTLGYLSPIQFIYRHHHLLPMYPSSTAP